MQDGESREPGSHGTDDGNIAGSRAAGPAIFTVDTGMCNVWGARYLQMTLGRRFLASFGHGCMANAMPQAIGAKLPAPDRRVVALCGPRALLVWS